MSRFDPCSWARRLPLPFALLPLLASTLLVAAACGHARTHVPAWARGTSQRPCMQPQSDAMEARFDVHVLETREGMAGAEGPGGGVSCGCN